MQPIGKAGKAYVHVNESERGSESLASREGACERDRTSMSE